MKEKSLLRFITCGSVDDGKSTLIGNLLFNSKKLFQDQVDTLKSDSKKRNFEGDVDYSLLLDGLSSEREQGITIDVAYRYFETPKRKFIVADTPGHVQYTRNMVTGASNSDLAVILVNASQGLLSQSRRHAFIVSMLQIKQVILAVNKMDLINYDEKRYQDIVDEFEDFCRKLDIEVIKPIPVSALKNENVITKSEKMPWYKGESFLDILENIYVKQSNNLVDFRLPVQLVVRPNHTFRGYAGRIASGTISTGEEVTILPSYKTAKVKSIHTPKGQQESAFAQQSVTITLDSEVDVDRGRMIVRSNNLPRNGNKLDILGCWLSEESLDLSKKYILRHTTRELSANVDKLLYKIDIDTLHRDKEVSSCELNDIFRMHITTSSDLYFDTYKRNKVTGGFILIDPTSKNTVAACTILGKQPEKRRNTQQIQSENIKYESTGITLSEREDANGHKGAVLWLTGLSGSGKSTIAKALVKRLFERKIQSTLLDGDNLRHGLNKDLAFSPQDREENIRRVGEVAKLFRDNGFITLCSFISPYKKDRDGVRALVDTNFYEVFVKCDIEVCKRRDPKGLYAKALSGQIKEFTGIDAPYEEPTTPEIIVETDLYEVDHLVDQIITKLEADGVFTAG